MIGLKEIHLPENVGGANVIALEKQMCKVCVESSGAQVFCLLGENAPSFGAVNNGSFRSTSFA